MKPTVFAGAAILVGLTLVGTIFWRENLALRREISGLRDQARADAESLRDLGEALRNAQATVASQGTEGQDLRLKMEALQKDIESAREATAPRRAARAQVFAGRRPLGTGWVLTGGTLTNAGGVVEAEPAVVLDEAVIKQFVANSERMSPAATVPRGVTVNYNYPDTGGGWSWYGPAYWVPDRPFPTNSPPGVGVPAQPSPTLPPPNTQLGNTGIWRPTQKPFLPAPSPWPIVTPQGGSRPPPRATAPVVRSAPAVRPPPVQAGRSSSFVAPPTRRNP